MSKQSLAARRQALVAECALQRIEVAMELSTLRMPAAGVSQYLTAGNLKLPLTIAGVVLGMIVTKPSRALPLLATGLSLFKLVTSVLSALRKPAD
ncbi:MAG: hypothetical protein V4484_23560 [Pseudomonadota bacterium]